MQDDAVRVTSDWLASFCQRTSGWLRELGLMGCHVADLTPLAMCARLTAVDLSCCRWIKDLTPLCALTGVRELWLANCHDIRSLDPLRGLPQITSLDISYAMVTSLEPRSSLSKLKKLS
jgi:hypothetical protein